MQGVVVTGISKRPDGGTFIITCPGFGTALFVVRVSPPGQWDLVDLKRSGTVDDVPYQGILHAPMMQVSRFVVAALPDAADEIQTLRLLSASGMGFPASGPSVTRLHVYNNTCLHIPPSISKLVNLQRLDLTNNNLTVLPPVVATLPALLVLVLNNNKFKEFPTCMVGHPMLDKVHVSDTAITSLPGTLRLFRAIHVEPATIPTRQLYWHTRYHMHFSDEFRHMVVVFFVCNRRVILPYLPTEMIWAILEFLCM
jgi:hypothetical protein